MICPTLKTDVVYSCSPKPYVLASGIDWLDGKAKVTTDQILYKQKILVLVPSLGLSAMAKAALRSRQITYSLALDYNICKLNMLLIH